MRDVLIRYVRVRDTDHHLLQPLLTKLTPQERLRIDRYVRLEDRLAFATGRALIRATLPSFGADGWSLEQNAYGKPLLNAPGGTPSPHFNISHCAGLVAGVFTSKAEVGIDVECLDRTRSDLAGVARFCFAESEIGYLESAAETDKATAFFSLWTLKEAYVKARGMGMSLPLADFAVDPPSLRISLPAALEEGPEAWKLWQSWPTPSHCMAVVARREPGEELTFCMEEAGLTSLR